MNGSFHSWSQVGKPTLVTSIKGGATLQQSAPPLAPQSLKPERIVPVPTACLVPGIVPVAKVFASKPPTVTTASSHDWGRF